MGRVEIISESGDGFESREEAGRLLAQRLAELRGKGVVALGIPRGGVVVARALARELDATLDVVLARKLGAPGQPELAIGAVTEDGREFLDRRLVAAMGVTGTYLEHEKVRVMTEIKRRASVYRQARPRVDLKGKVVVVTDDGVATGATMKASLWAVRREKPRELIAALPVGSEATLRTLEKDADRILCLQAPEWFEAVGQFYRQFGQVEDQEVVRILKEESQREASAPREGRR